MSDNELLHWGIKGMKWGRRRYQNKDGSLTPAGVKRYNKALKTAMDLRPPDDQKDDYATAKAKAIKSGSAADVLKYKGDLTQQEMQSIENRLRWEHNMADTAERDAIAAKGKSTIEKLGDKAETITVNANKGIRLWNTAANLINGFGDLDVPLPKISTDIDKDNRDTRRKAKKEKQKAEEAQKKREEQESQRDTVRAERETKRKQETEAKTKHDKDTKNQNGKETYTPKPDDIVDAPKSSKTTSKKDDPPTIDVYPWELKPAQKQIASSGESYIKSLPDYSQSQVSSETKQIGASYISGLLNPPREDDD